MRPPRPAGEGYHGAMPPTTRRRRPLATARKRKGGRGRLAPARRARGLDAGAVLLAADHPELAPLAEAVRAAGGVIAGAYREPLSGRPLLLAVLPTGAVQPTPFQRDLSAAHAKRLARRIEETGAFLDPLVVVRSPEGALWTPNGRHRLAAARHLGLRQVTALVSPDTGLAYRVLALNTEKAHNLKDRSLEVIRMARALAGERPRAKESAFAAEFESAELLTLGILYERDRRFAGGAYAPFLRKVDRFLERTLPVALRQREQWAARLEAIDARVKAIVDALRRRGLKSPHLRTYVVARINPVRSHRARRGETTAPMAMGEALTRMAAAARRFDPASVRPADLAVVAALAPEEG